MMHRFFIFFLAVVSVAALAGDRSGDHPDVRGVSARGRPVLHGRLVTPGAPKRVAPVSISQQEEVISDLEKSMAALATKLDQERRTLAAARAREADARQAEENRRLDAKRQQEAAQRQQIEAQRQREEAQVHQVAVTFNVSLAQAFCIKAATSLSPVPAPFDKDLYLSLTGKMGEIFRVFESNLSYASTMEHYGSDAFKASASKSDTDNCYLALDCATQIHGMFKSFDDATTRQIAKDFGELTVLGSYKGLNYHLYPTVNGAMKRIFEAFQKNYDRLKASGRIAV